VAGTTACVRAGFDLAEAEKPGDSGHGEREVGLDAAWRDTLLVDDGTMPDIGGPFHLIFVTSTTTTGKIGGLTGADAICAARAAAANRPGTFKALISDSNTNANTRLSIKYRLYNTADQLVAKNAYDLWDGQVTNAVDHDEHGTLVSSVYRVWNGTRDNGRGYKQNICQDWTTDAKAEWGEIGMLNKKATWIDDQAVTCDKLARIYCVSQ
jgi:hypothetical protein